jgi:glucose/arabinose dehydrogenase
MQGRSRSLIFPFLMIVLAAGLAAISPVTAFETERVQVMVPVSQRKSPFNQDRYLQVPKGFKIAVLARLPRARFILSVTPSDTLVALPFAGKIVLVRENADGSVRLIDFLEHLRKPQGMALWRGSQDSFLYVAESNRVIRMPFNPGSDAPGNPEVIIGDLPDGSSPELHGAYGHDLKDIVISHSNKLYLDIASASNASPSDATSNPVRSAIYEYDLDGRSGRLFARGIRNAEGLGILPGTSQLWAVVNGRDELRFPFHRAFRENSRDDFDKRITAYVDDHPPDELIHVRQAANYGWPFANPDPDSASGMDDMPFDPDVDNNPNWSKYPKNLFTRVDKGIQAHSAPLGMTFLQDTKAPLPFRNGLAVALHGSWDRSTKTGYKVIFFPWLDADKPGDPSDLVSGWLDDGSQQEWGRPVDVRPATDGESLLISDDLSGTIYRLSWR